MKTLKATIIALCATLLLASCGGGSPETVAKQFVEAGLSFDYKKAFELSSKELAAELREDIGEYTEDELKEEREYSLEYYKNLEYKVTSAEAEGDEAKVTFEFTNGDRITDGWVRLIKEDGQWKVDSESLNF